MVTTLHIEHPITSLPIWLGAFDTFADARRAAGVLAHRVHQPVGDERYVLVQLDFAEPGQAQRFEAFLRAQVWGRPEASPGLAGDPVTRMFHGIDA
jgi:hypothetical protein